MAYIFHVNTDREISYQIFHTIQGGRVIKIQHYKTLKGALRSYEKALENPQRFEYHYNDLKGHPQISHVVRIRLLRCVGNFYDKEIASKQF